MPKSTGREMVPSVSIDSARLSFKFIVMLSCWIGGEINFVDGSDKLTN
jgi:hypothetical protein